jgi:hypothetical protein
MRKAISYVLGFAVGLLAVAPPLNYNIPVVINSYAWLYGFIVAALLGTYLFSVKFPLALKILLAYLFMGCFLSMAPYLSFNAYILVIVAAWAFLGFATGEEEPVLNVVAAAFWVQVVMTAAQLMGADKLMNFDRPEPVFLGTVMQYMRFSSLLAIMTPLLILKNRLYIIPVLILCILSRSSSFALAVIAGATAYLFMTMKKERFLISIFAVLALASYYLWDAGSFKTAFTCGRVHVWGDIVRTWVMDTSHNFTLPLRGPMDWKSIFLGRGMDTFMPLFPVFKHDMNPFAQAHNCHLQLLWELGILGYSIIAAYAGRLMWRLRSRPLYIAGLVCMMINMFFAFPTRMTQTMFMMIAFMGICEKEARRIDWEGV